VNVLRKRLLAALEGHSAELASISRTLHDDIAQLLSAVGLQLDLLRMDLEEKAPESAGKVDEIQDILEVVVNKVRDLSQRVGPVRVERIGLRQALDWLVGSRRADFPGTIRLLFDSSVNATPERSHAFYRIAELALDNAIRHSKASLIEVIVKTSRQGASLEVRDDGTGFDPAEAQEDMQKLGLSLMNYVAENAGLVLTVSPGLGKGTVVSARAQKLNEPAANVRMTIG
jgi:signal transduction histidine kinase